MSYLQFCGVPLIDPFVPVVVVAFDFFIFSIMSSAHHRVPNFGLRRYGMVALKLSSQ